MKKITTLIVAVLFGMTINAQSYCLQLTEVSNDGQNLIMKIKMQGDIPFNLGTSNLQFGFSNDALGTPQLHQSIMEPPYYFTPTVTLPYEGQCSFNIELAFPDTGMDIEGYPNWTDLGMIIFPIVNSAEDYNFSWSYNGGTTETVAFLDDEATLFYASSEDCLVVDEAVGLEELDFFQDFNIYPNPAVDQLSVTYTIQDASDVSYIVYDALSSKVLEGSVDQKAGEQKLTIDLNGFSQGQYSLTLTVDDVVQTKRFDVIK